MQHGGRRPCTFPTRATTIAISNNINFKKIFNIFSIITKLGMQRKLKWLSYSEWYVEEICIYL